MNQVCSLAALNLAGRFQGTHYEGDCVKSRNSIDHLETSWDGCPRPGKRAANLRMSSTQRCPFAVYVVSYCLVYMSCMYWRVHVTHQVIYFEEPDPVLR